MKKKILHYGLSSNLGGIETYLHRITKYINHDNFQFDFIVPGFEKPALFEELSEYGCKFYNVTPRRSNPFKNIMEIKEILNIEHYDVLHCHQLSMSYITPVTLGLNSNIPTIIHSHSSNSPSSFTTRFLHYFNKKKLSGKKIQPIAVSKLAAEWMFNSDEDVAIINNGIDIREFQFNNEDRKKIRKEFKLEDDFVVIHVGTLKLVKNHQFLLEVFLELLKVKKNAKLLLVGADGNLRDEIDKKIISLGIQEKIIFTGVRKDIPALFSGSDALVFPSFYEGYPGVVVEAQTSGVPCLISNRITDEVVINENCVRYPLEKEPVEWVRKLITLQDFDDRFDAKENIRDAGLSVENEIIQLEGIYNKLIIEN